MPTLSKNARKGGGLGHPELVEPQEVAELKVRLPQEDQRSPLTNSEQPGQDLLDLRGEVAIAKTETPPASAKPQANKPATKSVPRPRRAFD